MKLSEFRSRLADDPEFQAAERELRPLLDLADDVLALRMQHGWSQAELAALMGTAQANISRIENGLANPTVRFLQRLGDVLRAEMTVRLTPLHHVSFETDTSAAVTQTTITSESIQVDDWPTFFGTFAGSSRTVTQSTSMTDARVSL